jgi:hypothetical protein
MKTSVPAANAAQPASDRGEQWELAAERGPDWLFVRLESPSQARGKEQLVDAIWGMIREHHASRVVIELDRVPALNDDLLGAIAEIGTRVRSEGGLIRACGLTAAEHRSEQLTAATAVPCFGTRSEAVGTRGVGASP